MPDTKAEDTQAARDQRRREQATGNPSDTSKRKGSGEKATDEAKSKREQEKARQAKAEKKAAEEQAAGRRTATEPAGPVPDPEDVPSSMVVAGEGVADGEDAPKETKAQARREDKAYAHPEQVKHYGVAGDTQRIIVRFNNKGYELDTQTALALRRDLDAAAINLNF